MTDRTFRAPAFTVRDPAGLARSLFHPAAPQSAPARAVTPSLAVATAADTGARRERAPEPPAARGGPPHWLTRRDPFRYLMDFYREPSARLALVISAIVLAYVGGAAMFWFHAIYLGEGGPAISPLYHWLLDSTAGFLGLGPALLVILPMAARAADGPGGTGRSATVGTAVFAVVGGTLFALVTGPGPVLHDALVGQGTWVADQVTAVLGDGRGATPSTLQLPPLVEMAVQVGGGLVTYIPLMWLSLVLARTVTRIRLRAVH